MTKSRIEQAKAKGYKQSVGKSCKCALCGSKAVIMRKQVRNAEGIWGFNSAILCKCGNEAMKFFPLKKQPEKVVF